MVTGQAGATPRRVLLTGATGFVGQALLERLLSDTTTEILLLIRPRRGQDACDRLAELLQGDAFAAWRQRVGDDSATHTLRDRVRVLAGDLGSLPRIIDRADPVTLDLVVHCAGDVSFDQAIDAAFATNVEGAARLYDALSQAGCTAHVVHVSTAYVWTDRAAIGPEEPVPHPYDWRAEAELAHRLRAERLAQDGPGSGTEAALGADGHRRAQELGWTDVYTMTKALGEQAAAERWAHAPLTILRPTIIESALRRPCPGWLDGFKVADPLFAAYARGGLPAFPGDPESVLDIVPVDVVVDAVLATGALPPPVGRPRYLHVGTGMSNPLVLERLREYVVGYFAERPWVGRDGRPVRPPRFRFAPQGALAARLHRQAAALRLLAALARRAPGSLGASLRTRIRRATRRVALTRQFVDLYEPYACSRTRFDDTCLRELGETLAGAGLTDQDGLPPEGSAWSVPTLNPRAVDWSTYWRERHLPALVRVMRERGTTPVERPCPARLDLTGVDVLVPEVMTTPAP